MGFRSLLGLDLAGKLSGSKRRYEGDWRRFDHRNVRCSITEWRYGHCTVSASAYCSDPTSTGFDVRPIAWFYQSRLFGSRVEAEAHLEAEIQRATLTHPDTKFYRTTVGQLGETIEEFCLAGSWHQAGHVPTYRRCEACGHETEEAICPNCGEPVLG
jgi:hypothetical protein